MNPCDTALTGKVALVTGGGRGIGRAVVLRLAGAGAAVGVLARTASEVADTVRAVENQGGRALALVADVSDEAAVKAAVARCEKELGPVDILVNNAGVFHHESIENTPADVWRRLMAVNVLGTVFCSRAVLPSMRARGAGRIINIASSAGRKGYPNQSAYCASKHAQIGFTKVLALETHGAGIRVHVVNPGGVDTRLVRDNRDDVDVSEYMRPEEIADVVCFLATQTGTATIDELMVRRVGARPF